MKLLIGFALLSVALALPAIQPIALPEPPAPEVTTLFEIPHLVDLPVFVAYDVPTFQRPDISPLMIPKEVVDALRTMGEAPFDMPADTVQIVEVAENDVTNGPADAVIVVDHVQEEPHLEAVADNELNTVHFVDVAENYDDLSKANDNVDTVADPVHFVDDAENVLLNVDAVKFVDNAEKAVLLGEEVPAEVDSVIVVEEVPSMPEEVSENQINADPVHFVNEPVPADLENIVSQAIVADAVKVVDTPFDWPGKRYDNPLLRSMN